MPSILIADDDPEIRAMLEIALAQAGHETESVGDGERALERARRGGHDLVLLDVGMPERDGLEVCRELRRTSSVPVIFLTAHGDEIDRVLGLEMGADDYVPKPFSPRELVARIKAVLKRSGAVAASPGLRRGALTLDPARHLCLVGETPVTLTAREAEILARLMERPDHVHARPRLVDAVYGTNVHVSDRTMDSHLRNLRAKLAHAGLDDAIETVHGVGLRMGACRLATA